MQTSMDNAKLQGFNADEQQYISEGYLAAKIGDTTYDYSALTAREKAEVERQIRANATGGQISQEQQDFLNQMNNTQFDATKRASADVERFNDRLEVEAQQLGTTSNALKLYTLAVEKAGKQNVKYSDAVAKNGAANYKFNKAYNEGRKVFEDSAEAWDTYIKAISNGEDISYDVADAAGEVVDSLKEMGLVLTEDQLADPDTLKKIKTIFSGTKEEAKAAFEELRDAAWLDNLITKFGIANQDAKTFIDTLKGMKVGDLLNDQAFFANFQQQLQNTKMTYDEWKS